MAKFAKHVENAPKTVYELESIGKKIEFSEKLDENDQAFLMELARRINRQKVSAALARLSVKYSR